MSEFRDFSTYLQRIVRLEKRAHDECNKRQYQTAEATMRQMVCEANALREWLRNQGGAC